MMAGMIAGNVYALFCNRWGESARPSGWQGGNRVPLPFHQGADLLVFVLADVKLAIFRLAKWSRG